MTQALEEAVSATSPDWSREKLRGWWDPSRRLLNSIRKYQLVVVKRGLIAHLHRKLLVLQHRFWSVITGAEIDLAASIGGRLILWKQQGIRVKQLQRRVP